MRTAPAQNAAHGTNGTNGAKGAGQGAGWSTWVSQTGRWWAVHDQALSASELAAGCRPVLYAEDFEALSERISEQDKLRAQFP
ncbi:MAG TPA: hypothetical protein VGQ05_07910 [Streptosporangiaceae bacterium]|nr:hypothetical protein [Streptosporangiaceae bacterium]